MSGLREDILEKVGRFWAEERKNLPFRPGVDPVPVSGKVVEADDLQALVDASLDGWLTAGRFNRDFEAGLRALFGVKHALSVNSGSSANLLAVSALGAASLGAEALRPGDEVVTAAAAFPTTVNPIVQNGFKPVFIDVDLGTYNARLESVEEAIGPRTRAVVLAHTLGNPFPVREIAELCRRKGLRLIEDCCDALGSTVGAGEDRRRVGSFGDAATCSFYPAHHITTGEGGAVLTGNAPIKRALLSLRDWGRDCFCDPGEDNTCGKRFGWKLGGLPEGYDHKYTYSNLGYNLKITDMQAAIGASQLKKAERFIEVRRKNFSKLRDGLQDLEEHLVLPEASADSNPAWFGFPVTLRRGGAARRRKLQEFLEKHRIGSRLLFAGNITKQPYFKGRDFRVVGDLAHTDAIMEGSLWIGVFPGLEDAHLDFVAERFHAFFSETAS